MKLTSISLLIAAKSLTAQFAAAPGSAPVKSPAVTQEYMASVSRGSGAYVQNTDVAAPEAFHKSSFQAGKDILATAADEFTQEARTLESGWAGANAEQRGYIEGAVIAGVRLAQMYARQLAKDLQVAVPDYSLTPGYLDVTADLVHSKQLLTDTAAIIMTIENGVPADKREGSFGKFLGGPAATKLPIVNLFAFHKRSKDAQAQIPIQTAKTYAANLLSTADRESKFLPIDEQPKSGTALAK